MTRSLTVPAGLTVTPGATIWLVRDADLCTDRRHYILRPSPHNPLGTRRHDVHDDIRCANPCGNSADGARRLLHQVPAEFVQGCAPCDHHQHPDDHTYCVACGPSPCPDCRVELVGECCECGGSHYPLDWERLSCSTCSNGTVHLGWGYTVGQPFPILGWRDSMPAQERIEYNEQYGTLILYQRSTSAGFMQMTDITATLAHHGDPAGLIGKWALRVQVTT